MPRTSLIAGLDSARQLELGYLIVEAEAALALAQLRRGDLHAATLLAGRVLAELDRPDLLGAIQPAEVYRSCWRVLVDCRRPPRRRGRHGRPALSAELGRQDRRHGAPRASFLRRVPANVELGKLGSDVE